MDDSESPKIDDQVYLDHRKSLEQLANDQLKTFDRSILTLSGGALGLSLTFLDNLIGPGTPRHPYMLGTAWAAYVVAIICNVLSYHTSWFDMQRELKKWDDCYTTGTGYRCGGNRFRTLTLVLNYASLGGFIVGTVLLIWFCCLNFLAGGNPASAAEAKTMIETQQQRSDADFGKTGAISNPPPLPSGAKAVAIKPGIPGGGVPSPSPPPPQPPVKR